MGGKRVTDLEIEVAFDLQDMGKKPKEIAQFMDIKVDRVYHILGKQRPHNMIKDFIDSFKSLWKFIIGDRS